MNTQENLEQEIWVMYYIVSPSVMAWDVVSTRRNLTIPTTVGPAGFVPTACSAVLENFQELRWVSTCIHEGVEGTMRAHTEAHEIALAAISYFHCVLLWGV